jgi:Skp family chaperone for outer membrane proteins
MKKNLLWMAGLLMTAAAIIGASQLLAESKDKKKPAPPRTRIVFINLTYVVKNCDKYQQFLVEIKEIVEPSQKRDAELRAQLEELRKQAEEPSLVPVKGEEGDKAASKKELEKQAKKIQQELKDNAAKIKKELAKRSDEEMKSLHADIEEAAQRYARSHDLDLVPYYNDAVTQEDMVSPQNITRKFNTGGFMPLYWNPSMDVSQDIVAILNRKMHKR